MAVSKDKLVVGVWQGRCADGNLAQNIARTAQVIDEAAAALCDFVCLPETFLSGYGTREIAESCAMVLDDPRLLDLARRAEDRKVVTLVGLSERRKGGAIANSQVVLDGGKVAGVYAKTQLTGGDAKERGFCSDDELPVFRARDVSFAIQICHDSSFPEIASTYAWKGARLLFSPHYNAIPSDKMDEHRIRVRNNHIGVAAHFGLVVARSNVIVTENPIHPGRLGYGDSAIYSPLGVPLAEAGLFTEKLVCADVSRWLTPAPGWNFRADLKPAIIEQWAAAALSAISHSAKTTEKLR
jgi:predicted amidohydrolase